MNAEKQARGRWQLALVALAFLAPAIAALILGKLGWQPGTSSFGEPILPQRSFAKVSVTLANGDPYAWRASTPRMTLIALPGPACARACVAQLTLMRNARITLHEDQSRLRLLYLGAVPSEAANSEAANAALMAEWQHGRDDNDALAQWRPSEPDSVAALLVESNGTALLYYPSGFDVNGLRKDLTQVIR